MSSDNSDNEINKVLFKTSKTIRDTQTHAQKVGKHYELILQGWKGWKATVRRVAF